MKKQAWFGFFLCVNLLGCQFNPSPPSPGTGHPPYPQQSQVLPSSKVSLSAPPSLQVLYQASLPTSQIGKIGIPFQSKFINDDIPLSLYVRKHNELAWRIFKKLQAKDPSKNLLFSPVQLTTALMVFYNFGSAKTKQTIAKLMGLETLSAEEINQEFENLRKALLLTYYVKRWESTDSLNNVLWLQSSSGNVNPEQTKTLQQLGMSVYKLPESSNKTLSHWPQWPQSHSDHLITSKNNAVLTIEQVLGEPWPQNFSLENTRLQNFQISRDTQIAIPLMRLDETYREDDLYSCHDYPELDIVTAGWDWILPGPFNSVSEHIQALDFDTYQTKTSKNRRITEGCVVTFPKFKMNSEHNLLTLLQLLDIPEPAKILALPGLISQPVQLENVIFPLAIQVDENGMDVSSKHRLQTLIPFAKESIFRVEINRPFFFVGQREQIIYLMGVVNDPSLP